MTAPSLTRRSALLAAAGLGLQVSFVGRALAADPALAHRKLVVILCRGAMDGLSAAPPYADPNYAGLRREIAIGRPGGEDGALDLDGHFGLHPRLATVHALAKAGQARIAPAIATPDRARSHFEAQDVLETGAGHVYAVSTGWLNRALDSLGPSRPQALSLGAQAPLILRGKVQAASWSSRGLNDTDPRLPSILADLYAKDPILGPALASGVQTQAMGDAILDQANAAMAADTEAGAMGAPARQYKDGDDAARGVGKQVAGFMTAKAGPGIVVISLNGFDTHVGQGAAKGALANRLGYMDALIDGIHTGLGPAWKDTTILAATEFGRTARVNGSHGTDHGTASTALLLGGGLKKGGIIGDWPTLKPAALFEGRDTTPTLDMRSLFKGVLAEQFGMDRKTLDTVVFPESAGAAPVTGLIA